jgi:hypothetical protein
MPAMTYEKLKRVVAQHEGTIYIDMPGLGPVLVDRLNLMSLLDFGRPATLTSSGYVLWRAGDTLLLAYRQQYRFSTEGRQ